jgi:hypothetical protein
MNYWKRSICLVSSTSVLVMLVALCSTIAIAKILKPIPLIPLVHEAEEVEVWVPTEEDIAFQTEMYSIIERTQLDLDTIRAGIDRILYKLERFDYPDGTYDSIRYVVGGKIDKRRNKN